MEQFIEQQVKENLLSIVLKIGKGMKKAIGNKWEKFKTDYQLVFWDYLKEAYKKYSTIKNLIYRTEPQPLLGPKGLFEIPYVHKDTGDIKVDSMDTILNIGSHFLIIEGTGGSGKSTLMKFLFLSALEAKDFIPVFIELRGIDNIVGDYDLEDLFFDELSNLGSTLDPDYMERSLNSGVYIFLLDGYDEISSEKRAIFDIKLEKFIDRYSENYYMLSSRPFDSFIKMQRFTVLDILPFDKDQAISQIKKIRYNQETKDKVINALKNEGLYEKYKSFASNPLLLTILLLTYDNFSILPQKIHNFYAEAFNTMLHRHDATKGGNYSREFKCGLSDDEYKKSFAKFCFYTYYHEMTVFSRDQIKTILQKVNLSYDVDDYIDDLHNALCVLIQEGCYYKFSHRSFQEYFSAFYLKELDDKNMQKCGIGLIKKNPEILAKDTVMLMLADMARERFLRYILSPLLLEIQQLATGEDPFLFYLSLNCIVIRRVRPSVIPPQYTLLVSIGGDENVDYELADLYFSLSFLVSKLFDDQNKEKAAEEIAAQEFIAQILPLFEKEEVENSLSLDIPSEYYLENQELLKIIKQTWIGREIRCFMHALEYIATIDEENDDLIDSILQED